MPGHHDSDHRGTQFTARQLVLLSSLLMLVGAGVFVGGMFVGRGTAPGMTDALEAQDTAPVPPASRATAGSPVQGPEAPAEDAVRIPIRSPDRPAPPPAPPVPRAAPVAATSLEQESNRTLTAPEPRGAANPPPAAATDPPKPAATGKYTVQIAAFRDRVAAERMLEQLTARGIEGAYLEGTPAGIFRVRIGEFDTPEAAQPLAARLESEQFAVLVTSR